MADAAARKVKGSRTEGLRGLLGEDCVDGKDGGSSCEAYHAAACGSHTRYGIEVL